MVIWVFIYKIKKNNVFFFTFFTCSKFPTLSESFLAAMTVLHIYKIQKRISFLSQFSQCLHECFVSQTSSSIVSSCLSCISSVKSKTDFFPSQFVQLHEFPLTGAMSLETSIVISLPVCFYKIFWDILKVEFPTNKTYFWSDHYNFIWQISHIKCW